MCQSANILGGCAWSKVLYKTFNFVQSQLLIIFAFFKVKAEKSPLQKQRPRHISVAQTHSHIHIHFIHQFDFKLAYKVLGSIIVFSHRTSYNWLSHIPCPLYVLLLPSSFVPMSHVSICSLTRSSAHLFILSWSF